MGPKEQNNHETALKKICIGCFMMMTRWDSEMESRDLKFIKPESRKES